MRDLKGKKEDIYARGERYVDCIYTVLAELARQPGTDATTACQRVRGTCNSKIQVRGFLYSEIGMYIYRVRVTLDP